MMFFRHSQLSIMSAAASCTLHSQGEENNLETEKYVFGNVRKTTTDPVFIEEVFPVIQLDWYLSSGEGRKSLNHFRQTL